eukprot:CCRYP_017735-RA/>CCRYP_017735-RA protein AED:0.09 eAED:0.09 QI:237/1/0.5/1/0/0/2/0/56
MRAWRASIRSSCLRSSRDETLLLIFSKPSVPALSKEGTSFPAIFSDSMTSTVDIHR